MCTYSISSDLNGNITPPSLCVFMNVCVCVRLSPAHFFKTYWAMANDLAWIALFCSSSVIQWGSHDTLLFPFPAGEHERRARGEVIDKDTAESGGWNIYWNERRRRRMFFFFIYPVVSHQGSIVLPHCWYFCRIVSRNCHEWARSVCVCECVRADWDPFVESIYNHMVSNKYLKNTTNLKWNMPGLKHSDCHIHEQQSSRHKSTHTHTHTYVHKHGRRAKRRSSIFTWISIVECGSLKAEVLETRALQHLSPFPPPIL